MKVGPSQLLAGKARRRPSGDPTSSGEGKLRKNAVAGACDEGARQRAGPWKPCRQAELKGRGSILLAGKAVRASYRVQSGSEGCFSHVDHSGQWCIQLRQVDP